MFKNRQNKYTFHDLFFGRAAWQKRLMLGSFSFCFQSWNLKFLATYSQFSNSKSFKNFINKVYLELLHFDFSGSRFSGYGPSHRTILTTPLQWRFQSRTDHCQHGDYQGLPENCNDLFSSQRSMQEASLGFQTITPSATKGIKLQNKWQNEEVKLIYMQEARSKINKALKVGSWVTTNTEDWKKFCLSSHIICC